MKYDGYKEIIQNWTIPYLTCETAKCGQCLREQIKAEVCKEILATGQEIERSTIRYVTDEAKRRWQQTPLYIRVKAMLDNGKTITDIEAELAKEGIEI